MNPLKKIIVSDYDSQWPILFAQVEKIFCLLFESIEYHYTIEHVGSTSVPGLAAKPVLDIDIIIQHRDHLPIFISQLATLGYRHVGDLGIQDREAMKLSDAIVPSKENQLNNELLKKTPHNLYICLESAGSLHNHLVLRNHLRNNSKDRDQYSALKKQLATEFPNDIDQYIAGKTEFILSILQQYNFDTHTLQAIERANTSPVKP